MVIVAVPAAVIALLVALAAALTFYASRQLFRAAFEALADGLGVLGPALLSGLDLLLGQIPGRTQAWADEAVTALAHVIAGVPEGLTQLVDAILAWATAVVYGIRTATDGVIDFVTQAALALVQQAIALIRVDVDTLFNVYLPNLQWFIEAVQAELWGALGALTARVAAVEAQLGQSIEQAWREALAGLGASIEALRADLYQRVAGIEAGIDARIGALGAAIDGHVTALFDALARDLATLRQALADLIPGLEARIGAVEAAGIVSVGVVAAEVATVAKWIHDCGAPMCTHYGPDIPFIQQFNALLASGAVAALVTAAIVDPEGTAAAVSDALDGPLGTVSGAFTALVR